MLFPVESPVRVLIMTQPGAGSDHVRCPPPQDPITRAFAVSTIAWDRCRWIACRLVRGCVPPRSADGPRSIGTGCSCPAGGAALACAAEPHVVWRLRPTRLQRPVSSGDGASGCTPHEALAYLVSVALFAALLNGTAVPRPVAGAIIGAVCLAGNLVTTRTTFALGLAVGLGALVALVVGRLRVAGG